MKFTRKIYEVMGTLKMTHAFDTISWGNEKYFQLEYATLKSKHESKTSNLNKKKHADAYASFHAVVQTLLG